jgi:Tfp pilus assembly protein PilX
MREKESGIILLTVLMYLLMMNVLILATHEMVRTNTKIKYAMQNRQQLSQVMEIAINNIEKALQQNKIPLCRRTWQNANAYYQQTLTEWQNTENCHLQAGTVTLDYEIELMPINPCEHVMFWKKASHQIEEQPAQHYRLTLRGTLHKAAKIIQTTGIMVTQNAETVCQQKAIFVDIGRHSWRE